MNHEDNNNKKEMDDTDWVSVFEALKKEADELYPDGRVKILIPGKARRPPTAS